MLALLNAIHAETMKPRVDRWVSWLRAAREPDAEVDQCVVEAIEALDAIEKGAKATRELLRGALHADMLASGVLSFEATNYVASHVSASVDVLVSDEQAIHAARPDLFKPQPDKLDKAALKKLLNAGIKVEGATLSNGGPGHVLIRGKKGNAA
nr:siphovirus Gp157 family protein [Gluconacetobacter azotocaptans]